MKKAKQLQSILLPLPSTFKPVKVIQGLKDAITIIISFLEELSLLQISNISNARLLRAVENSIAIFFNVNKKKFSSVHDSFQKRYQLRLFESECKEKVETLKKLTSMQHSITPKKMFNSIIESFKLKNDTPIQELEKFNAQLMIELRAVSSLPFNQWT